MRACVRLDDGAYSGWFALKHGLRQACVLAHLLFNIFFVTVISVAYTHFKVDKDIMNALVHPRKKPEAGGQGRATGGESALETSLWRMLCADYAGVVSHLPEQLRKMMGVIVVVCAALGLTVLETKTEIMCLRKKRMSESIAIFSVESAGQVYNELNEFVYLGGSVNNNVRRPVHRGQPVLTQHMVQLPEAHHRTV